MGYCLDKTTDSGHADGIILSTSKTYFLNVKKFNFINYNELKFLIAGFKGSKYESSKRINRFY